MSGHTFELIVTPRLLRQFAGLWIVLFGFLACREWLGHGNGWLATGFAVLGGGVGFCGLVNPEIIRPIFLVMMTVTRPIGWLVSQVVLSLLFYVVFTPVGFVFKLLGRDILGLRKSDRATYWSPKKMPEDLASYYRQS